LASLSLREFLDKVASTAEPVPAGGSVAAFTGASSAALLALVCGVLQRRHVADIGRLERQAVALQQELLRLVDEDALAFHAFLEAKRSGADQAAIAARTSRIPLQIAAACASVVDLSREIETPTSGSILGDVHAARHLAQAALTAAVELAEENIGLNPTVEAQNALRDEIAVLRAPR
jgi:formiminotetrahydrofolate cyclodeaminase